jgi:hypothetical protein
MHEFLDLLLNLPWWAKGAVMLLTSGFFLRMMLHFFEYFSKKNSSEVVISATFNDVATASMEMLLRTVAMPKMTDIVPNFWRRRKLLMALARCNGTCHVVRMTNKADATIIIKSIRNRVSILCALGNLARMLGMPTVSFAAYAALTGEPNDNELQEEKPRIVLSTVDRMQDCADGTLEDKEHGPRRKTLRHMLALIKTPDSLALITPVEITIIDMQSMINSIRVTVQQAETEVQSLIERLRTAAKGAAK